MNKANKLFKKAKVAAILAIIALTNCFAQAHDYMVPEQGLITASISDKGVNRIAIENDRIAQVIGNEDEYIIESDANLGQIFLTPTLRAPQEISLRFLTERDKIIDAKLMIKKIEPQTINFKYKNDANPVNVNTILQPISTSVTRANQIDSDNATQQIIANLKLAYSNKLPGIKLATLGCLGQTNKLKGLKLVEATQYNLNKQIIVKAVVTNNQKDELRLNEADFASCMQMVEAIALDKQQLAPKAKTTIYLVGKDGK